MKNRPSTIKDVARVLGIAPSTVSRALRGHSSISDSTRQRVRETADELGYVLNLPASLMRNSRSLVIGLIVPDICNDFYSTMASVLTEHSRARSFQVMLCNTDDDPAIEERHVRGLIEARVAGVVITPTPAPTETTKQLLQALPTVQLLREVAGIRGEIVSMRDDVGIRAATSSLLRLGHRRIAYAGTSGETSVGLRRLQGFIDAHAEANVAIDDTLVLLMRPREGLGFDAVRQLLSRTDRPSALVMGSTQLTPGGLRAVAEAGLRIPEDISVTGYGEHPWCSLLAPPLTTVSLPVEAMAQKAVHAIFQMIQKTEPQLFADHELLPHLVVRGTTAPASDAARP